MADAQAFRMTHYMQAYTKDRQIEVPSGYELKADEELGVKFLVDQQTGVKLLDHPVRFPSGVRHYQGYRWLYVYLHSRGMRQLLQGNLPPMLPASAQEPQAFMSRDAIADNFDNKMQRELTGSCEFCVAFCMPSNLVTQGNVPNRDVWLIRFIHDKVGPFLNAVRLGDVEKVQEGLQDLDGDVVDDDDTTALMFAARAGHAEVVRMLLAAQADPLQVNNAGATALMWADTNGRAEVVRQLLPLCGKDAKGAHGMTALDMVQEAQHVDAAAVLS